VRVRFVLFGVEEIGLHGSFHYAAAVDDSPWVVVNIDGAGGSRGPGVHTHGFDELAEPFRTAAERFDAPLEVDPETIVGTDAWPFLERGTPAVTLYSQSQGDDRERGHTHADTLEKLDPRDLRALAALFSESVLELADSDREFERKSPETIRETLTDGDVLALEAGDRWHFD
jgi:Zn-dependent M28 family amino/carboxypeptidase